MGRSWRLYWVTKFCESQEAGNLREGTAGRPKRLRRDQSNTPELQPNRPAYSGVGGPEKKELWVAA
jgi:hypothetical protein